MERCVGTVNRLYVLCVMWSCRGLALSDREQNIKFTHNIALNYYKVMHASAVSLNFNKLLF